MKGEQGAATNTPADALEARWLGYSKGLDQKSKLNMSLPQAIHKTNQPIWVKGHVCVIYKPHTSAFKQIKCKLGQHKTQCRGKTSLNLLDNFKASLKL